MSQPEWEFVSNIGDANPIDYGGCFVFVDKTGVYAPEIEILVEPCEGDDEIWRVYRAVMEPCTWIDGVLSDNRFHPDKPAWFAKTEKERESRPQDSTYFKDLAEYLGQSVDELARWFCSGSVLKRAFVWKAVGEYHGLENLDSYPLRLTREEVEERYEKHPYVDEAVV